jgi:transposase
MDGMFEGGGRCGLRCGARRRRWPAASKAAIVAESLVAGAKVSEVAARHGVNANMLSTWRGQALAGDMTTRNAPKAALISPAFTFAPVKVVAGGPQPDARADIQAAVGAIEIVLGDASIRVAKGVDTATLSRVLAAVRGGRV